jgi:hypothetical protein
MLMAYRSFTDICKVAPRMYETLSQVGSIETSQNLSIRSFPNRTNLQQTQRHIPHCRGDPHSSLGLSDTEFGSEVTWI